MHSLMTQDMDRLQGLTDDSTRDCDDMPDFGTQSLARVHCTCCGDDHLVKDVEFMNVEEDLYGRDVLEFRCPDLGTSTKALVHLE